jgi:hypothetical protein
MFADQIRSANTEREIYFLLTSYLESLPFSGNLQWSIPENVTRLPLYGKADIRNRFDQLMLELDLASKRLDDESCALIRQGVYVFGFALNRIDVLQDQQHAWQHGISSAGSDARAA